MFSFHICHRRNLCLLPLLVLHSANAVAVVAEKESPEIFNTAYLIQVFGSLVVVFACLFGLIFLLKKMNGIPMNDRRLIQVLGSAKVGSREKILLVKAGEQELLLGVATGGVRTLHVFEPGAVAAADEDRDFASVMEASTLQEAKS